MATKHILNKSPQLPGLMLLRNHERESIHGIDAEIQSSKKSRVLFSFRVIPMHDEWCQVTPFCECLVATR